MGGFEFAFETVGIGVVGDVVTFLGDLAGRGFVEGFFDAAFFVNDGVFLVEGGHGWGRDV